MTQRYTISNDPLFYVTVIFFALLTTALPALIGQPVFLIIAQTVALFTFVLITLHRQLIRQTLLVLALWLLTQFLTFLAITVFAEERVQFAIPNGFVYGMTYIDWYFGVSGVLRPDSFTAQPIMRTAELIGITLGTLLTAGFAGIWFLVRAVNLAAFHMGVVFLVNDNPAAILGALPLWAIIRLIGFAALVVLLAEPILTSNWNPFFYLKRRRRLAIVALGFTAGGLLVEGLLPDLWRTLFR